MSEFVTSSESVKSLAEALSKAQGELENAAKSSLNPHFQSKYADLAGLLNVARPVLSKHGLAVLQHPTFEDGKVSVTTILLHSSGEWYKSTLSSPVSKSDAQGIGSATTYCRRYALAAIIGIAQEDDDGNAATGRTSGGEKKQEEAANLDQTIYSALETAKTMDDVATIWKAIPVGVRHLYASTKDAAKARVAPAPKDAAA